MIPLLVGAGIAGVLGLAEAEATKDTQKEAQNTLDKARNIYDSAKRNLENQQKDTEYALKSLGEAKRRILTGVITDFVAAFSNFKNVDFRQSDGIYELDNLKAPKFTESDFLSIQQLSETGENLAKGAVAGGAAGTAIALGAGAASVNALLGAGTMSAVASFAGIGGAAQLAIAGVGGLAPALGIVAGPALLIGGFASYCKADENLNKAKSALAEAEVAAKQMKTAESLCKQIENKSQMFSYLLNELEPLLRASVNELHKLSGSPIKSDYNNLTINEKQFLAMSGAIAKAIKSVVDTPILTSSGNVTRKSKTVYDDISNALPDYKSKQNMLIYLIS